MQQPWLPGSCFVDQADLNLSLSSAGIKGECDHHWSMQTLLSLYLLLICLNLIYHLVPFPSTLKVFLSIYYEAGHRFAVFIWENPSVDFITDR